MGLCWIIFGAVLVHFGLSGAFLGQLGLFLGQLGAVLGYLRPSWVILGPSWEQELLRELMQIGTISGLLNVHSFWSSFWDPIFFEYFWNPDFNQFLEAFLLFLGSVLAPISGPDRPKKGTR